MDVRACAPQMRWVGRRARNSGSRIEGRTTWAVPGHAVVVRLMRYTTGIPCHSGRSIVEYESICC
jgi:hypothetical protein